MKIKTYFNKNLEKEFLTYEQQNYLPYIRWIFLLFIILYGAYGITDINYYPNDWQFLYVIRFGIVIPVLLLVIGLSFTKRFLVHQNQLIAFSVFIGGIGIAYMLILSPENIIYYGGLFMVFSSGYLLVRLRFLPATIAGWSILLFHIVGYSIINGDFSEAFMYGFTFFIGANFIGMTGAYQIEVMNRKRFLAEKNISAYLQESEQYHELLLNSTASGIYAVDNHDVCSYVNDNLIRLLGYDNKEEIIGKKSHSLFHHSYQDGTPFPAEACPLVRAFESKKSINNEDDIIWRKDGTFFPVSYSSSPKIIDGEVVGSVVTFYDISERKHYEKALIESNIRFKTLFEKAPLGYQSLDVNGDFLEVNQTWLDMMGYEKDEVIGQWFGDFLTPSYQTAFIERFKLFKEKGRVKAEFEMVKKNKEKVFIEFAGLVGYDKNNVFQQTFCTLNNITKRKEMELEKKEKEKQLNDSQTLMAYIIEHNSAAVAVHDNDLNYVYVSKKYLEQYEVKEEDIIGMHHYDVFPDLPQKWRDVHQRALNGEVVSEDRDAYVKEDGMILWTRWEARPWYESTGDIAGIIIYTEVINKQIEAEKEREYLLTHDQLTGLSNRLYFDQKIKALDIKENRPLAVIHFDINGLKVINEAFGYTYGDQLVKYAAKVLKETFSDAVISRVGGDEFSVLMTSTSRKEAQLKAKTVAKLINKYRVKGLQSSVSYGIAVSQSDESSQNLFINAENEMFSNKMFESTSYRNNSIKTILKVYQEKNPREENHSNRVSELCEKMGHALNMEDSDIKMLKTISHLHDIGKIAIDEAILNKPGKLTEEEWEKVKKHPEIGARIISTSDEYAPIAEDILSHHERYDGKGYPRGLSGSKIPLRARITSIVDAYDAMISERTYRKAKTHDEAIVEIKKYSNQQFDPELVKVFVTLFDNNKKLNATL